MTKQTRELTCIGCPLGCLLHVEMADGAAMQVEGAGCENGRRYARSECTRPARMLTTTVRLAGVGTEPPDGRHMLPVRTRAPIPKESLAACMRALRHVRVNPPVRAGQVILPDAAGTGVDIVAAEDILLP